MPTAKRRRVKASTKARIKDENTRAIANGVLTTVDKLESGETPTNNSRSELHLIWNNPITKDKILTLLTGGATLSSVAAAVSVNPGTFCGWLALGTKEERGTFREFRDAVLAAIGEACAFSEVSLREKDPKWWLQHGPRNLLGENEWNAVTRDAKQQPTSTVNVQGNAVISPLITPQPDAVTQQHLDRSGQFLIDDQQPITDGNRS